MPPNTSELEYKTIAGHTFHIRGQANGRDQSELNILMGDSSRVEDGRVIHVNVLKAFPFLIERFVIRWSGGPQKTGREILNHLYEQPADPHEDVVMVLGSFIMNHVKGLTVTEEDVSKKKG